RLGHELGATPPGGFRIQVERPTRRRKLVPIPHPRHEHVPLPLVIRNDARDVEVHRRKRGVLEWCRGADIGELLELRHLVDNRLWTVSVAKPPAGDAIGFPEALDHENLLRELGGGSWRAVIVKRAIDFVAE